MVIIAITIVVMMTIGDVQVLLLMKYSDMPLYCNKPNLSKYVFNSRSIVRIYTFRWNLWKHEKEIRQCSLLILRGNCECDFLWDSFIQWRHVIWAAPMLARLIKKFFRKSRSSQNVNNYFLCWGDFVNIPYKLTLCLFTTKFNALVSECCGKWR